VGDANAFAACMLTCKAFYECFTQEEKETIKKEYSSVISISRVIRIHENLVHYSPFVNGLEVTDEEYEIGASSDMINKSCGIFSLAKGEWKVWNCCNREYCVYGLCDSDTYSTKLPMSVVHTTKSSDYVHGIAKKNKVDNLLRECYEEDMTELTNEDIMTFEEWLLESGTHYVACGAGIMNTRREYYNSVLYASFNPSGKMIAFWLLPDSYDPLACLTLHT